jgi:hypothetical protein
MPYNVTITLKSDVCWKYAIIINKGGAEPFIVVAKRSGGLASQAGSGKQETSGTGNL